MTEPRAILPDLPDMMAAGMCLTEALAFWHVMTSAPAQPPQYWWDVLLVRREPASNSVH